MQVKTLMDGPREGRGASPFESDVPASGNVHASDDVRDVHGIRVRARPQSQHPTSHIQCLSSGPPDSPQATT